MLVFKVGGYQNAIFLGVWEFRVGADKPSQTKDCPPGLRSANQPSSKNRSKMEKAKGGYFFLALFIFGVFSDANIL